MTLLDELRSSPQVTVTLAQAAAILGVDPRTVSGAVRAGDIPAVRVGRRVLIPKHRFLAYLDGSASGISDDSTAASVTPRQDPTETLRARLIAALSEPYETA